MSERQTTGWMPGLPPKDDRTYEVRQRCLGAGGKPWVAQDAPAAFWDGGRLCRRSAFHGGLVHLVLMNEWRLP